MPLICRVARALSCNCRSNIACKIPLPSSLYSFVPLPLHVYWSLQFAAGHLTQMQTKGKTGFGLIEVQAKSTREIKGAFAQYP